MKARGKKKGFTLLEMMVVIAILGILAVMAYPSFQATLAINRAKYGEGEINKALAYARSEAISRNKYIGVCPKKSDEADVCAIKIDDCPSVKAPSTALNGCSWTNGLLVYVDNNINSTYDPEIDEIIQHFYISKKPLTIKLDTLNLTWKAGGLSLQHPVGKSVKDQVVSIIPYKDPTNTNHLRQCTISAIGQIICNVKR